MKQLKNLNPLSLENIEKRAKRRFRYRAFKDEYIEYRQAAIIFKILFSIISIFFGTYFFNDLFSKSAVPDELKGSTNVNIVSTIWLLSAILPIVFEVTKHLSLPIVVDSLIRKKWGKIIIPFIISSLMIGVSYYCTIKGSSYFFDKEDFQTEKIESEYKFMEDSTRNHFDEKIETKERFIKQLQENTSDNSLISSTIDKINKLDNEYAFTTRKMEESIRVNQNKDSVRTYYKLMLNRIEKRIEAEQERSSKLLSSNEEVMLDAITTKRALEADKENSLTKLDAEKKAALNGLTSENSLMLDYIFLIAIGIETLILSCIIFISYYDYKITIDSTGYTNFKELENKYTLTEKELSKTKELLEKLIKKGEINESFSHGSKNGTDKENHLSGVGTDNGTVIKKNGTAQNKLNEGKKQKNNSVTSKDAQIEYLLGEGDSYSKIAKKLGVSRRDISRVKKEMNTIDKS